MEPITFWVVLLPTLAQFIRQFGLLTTTYKKHNSPVFYLILTLIPLIALTISSTFHLSIALYILTTHLLLFLTTRNHPARNPREGVWQYR